MKISVVTYVGGDFDVIIIDPETGKEVTLSGEKKLTDGELEMLTRLAPSCVWTEYETSQSP